MSFSEQAQARPLPLGAALFCRATRLWPLHRGRSFLLRKLEVLAPPDAFLATIPFVDGLKMDVFWDDREGRKIAAFGEQDADVARFLRVAVEHAPPSRRRFVDVGANLGTFSLFLAARAGVFVDAFEPQPRLASLLAANATRNGVGEKIRIHSVALGSEAGEVRLQVPAGFSGGARIEADAVEGIPVPIRRLDAEIAPEAWEETAVMKVDVEGFETEVFAGATALFARRKPPLVFELSADEMARRKWSASELRGLLEAAGYRDFYALDRVLYPVGNGVHPVANIVALAPPDAGLRDLFGYDPDFRPRPLPHWPVIESGF